MLRVVAIIDRGDPVIDEDEGLAEVKRAHIVYRTTPPTIDSLRS